MTFWGFGGVTLGDLFFVEWKVFLEGGVLFFGGGGGEGKSCVFFCFWLGGEVGNVFFLFGSRCFCFFSFGAFGNLAELIESIRGQFAALSFFSCRHATHWQ